MRLYRTAKGAWVGTQDDARKDGKGWTQVEVPTDKANLLAFLNATVAPANDNSQSHPAFKQGASDAQRGMTANPYSLPEYREQWEAGHAYAYANGVAAMESFAVRTRGKSVRGRGR